MLDRTVLTDGLLTKRASNGRTNSIGEDVAVIELSVLFDTFSRHDDTRRFRALIESLSNAVEARY